MKSSSPILPVVTVAARPRASLVAVLLAVSAVSAFAACGAPPGAATTPPPPVASSAAEQPRPLEVALDPRAVRCGIDDRPRSVVSELSGVFDDADEAFRGGARQARMVMLPPPGSRPRPKPRPPFRPPPPPPPPGGAFPPAEDAAEPPLVPGWARPWSLEVAPRRWPDGATPTPPREIVASLDGVRTALRACLELVDGEPGHDTSRPYALRASLAASGEALVVTPVADGQPTLFQRCLLEQTCRLHTPPLAAAADLTLDVRAFREPPPPPVVPTEINPRVGTSVTMELDPRGPNGLARQAFESAASVCRANGTPGTGAQIVIEGGAPGQRIRSIATRGVDGQPPLRDASVACVVAQLRATLDGRIASPRVIGTVRWITR